MIRLYDKPLIPIKHVARLFVYICLVSAQLSYGQSNVVRQPTNSRSNSTAQNTTRTAFQTSSAPQSYKAQRYITSGSAVGNNSGIRAESVSAQRVERPPIQYNSRDYRQREAPTPAANQSQMKSGYGHGVYRTVSDLELAPSSGGHEIDGTLSPIRGQKNKGQDASDNSKWQQNALSDYQRSFSGYQGDLVQRQSLGNEQSPTKSFDAHGTFGGLRPVQNEVVYLPQKRQAPKQGANNESSLQPSRTTSLGRPPARGNSAIQPVFQPKARVAAIPRPPQSEAIADIAIPSFGPPASQDASGVGQASQGGLNSNSIVDTSPRSGNSASPLAENRSIPGGTSDAINNRYEKALADAANGSQSSSTSALDALPPSLLGKSPSSTRVPARNPNQIPEPVVAQELPGVSAIPTQPLNGNSPIGIGGGQPLVAPGMRPPAPPGMQMPGQQKGPFKAPKYDGPFFIDSYGEIKGPPVDALAKPVPYDPYAFMPNPVSSIPADPHQEAAIYRGKFPVPTQRPLIELWRPLYTSGVYAPGKNWFGKYNLVMPHFMVYGDFRSGVGVHDNGNFDTQTGAVRANLDMDLEITATERVHAFMGPLDRGGDFTRVDFNNNQFIFRNRTDIRLDALFFEGDAGAIWGGLTQQDGPFDLPFSFGFQPFFYQNGIWANDNAIGAAFALPARHSKLLKWSNYDATFFWAADQVTSDAFAGDNTAAEFFGTAWFIEAYDGYIELDYAFVLDDSGADRSYQNFAVAFSKRYFHRISNSIRFILNFDQSIASDQRTADGHLLLIENSLITGAPNTFVPYLNFFYGQGRTQSLARAGGVGGILNNTGINFETDGLTNYPTLDPTGVNTMGAALGLNMLGKNFNQQLVLEVAALTANGSQQFRNAQGDQYAVGMRYQKPLSNAWIFRTDHMVGFLRNAEDIRGNRVELRWKF